MRMVKEAVQSDWVKYFLSSSIPLFFAAVWLVPTIKTDVDHIKDAVAENKVYRTDATKEYAKSLNELKTAVTGMSIHIVELSSSLSSRIQAVEISNEFIKEVANTKVKTITADVETSKNEISRLRDEIKELRMSIQNTK